MASGALVIIDLILRGRDGKSALHPTRDANLPPYKMSVQLCGRYSHGIITPHTVRRHERCLLRGFSNFEAAIL